MGLPSELSSPNATPWSSLLACRARTAEGRPPLALFALGRARRGAGSFPAMPDGTRSQAPGNRVVLETQGRHSPRHHLCHQELMWN